MWHYHKHHLQHSHHHHHCQHRHDQIEYFYGKWKRSFDDNMSEWRLWQEETLMASSKNEKEKRRNCFRSWEVLWKRFDKDAEKSVSMQSRKCGELNRDLANKLMAGIDWLLCPKGVFNNTEGFGIHFPTTHWPSRKALMYIYVYRLFYYSWSLWIPESMDMEKDSVRAMYLIYGIVYYTMHTMYGIVYYSISCEVVMATPRRLCIN